MASTSLDRDAANLLEVAIVGGGIAGTYAAWRLAESGVYPANRIAVFEAGQQFGGRLKSLKLAEEGDLVAEAGGLSFHRTHRHVGRLAKQLGLVVVEYPIGSRRSLLNLRGRTRVYRKLRYHLMRPFAFDVARRTQINGVTGLVHTAAEAVLPGSASFSEEDWNRAFREATFMGRPLRAWPLRAVLLRLLGPEATRFLRDASAYSLFTDAPNATAGLAWNLTELALGGSMSRLAEGYQSLPLALAQRLAEGGAGLHLGHRLVAIDRKPDGFDLQFTDHDSATVRAVVARRVVLALPPKPMQAVSGAVELIGNRTLADIKPWPFGVIGLVYPSAWWARIGIERGRSVTDLPARQIWHFGRSAARPGLLLSHCDGDDLEFWRHLAPSAADGQGFTRVEPDGILAQELHRQVGSIYSPVVGKALPLPKAGFFQDWSSADYGGAVHLWARGIEPAAAIEAAMQPAPDLPLFICGEAWSGNQGWVEGALSQTEATLQRHFGLHPPDWLS